MKRRIDYVVGERRKEDLPKITANIDKATSFLGWKITKSLEDMCRDSYEFIIKRQQSKLSLPE
jgi:UDP-glucose 4-epimerase